MAGSRTALEDGGACAAQEAVAERAPAYLYFVFDVSGSMGRAPWGDPTEKWDPVTAAFEGFLASPEATGISAAMTLFPDTVNDHCSTSSYTTPDVPLTALPNVAPFAAALPLAKNLGTDEHGTPTLPALKGVLPSAKANALAHPEAKTVVVLVTDGEPNNCSGNSIENIEAEVEKYKDLVPTYVIGVGTSVTNLNRIASKGGTGSAIQIDVGQPSVTEKQLTDTINAIRLKSLSCELAIPSPPSGETLDYGKINVSYTPSKGTKQTLAYDTACTAGGWRFDSESNPTKIILCESLCDTVKDDPSGVVSVEFGCTRREAGGVK